MDNPETDMVDDSYQTTIRMVPIVGPNGLKLIGATCVT